MTGDIIVCDQQSGYMLTKDQLDGQVKQLGYWSRSQRVIESNYTNTHNAANAFIWAILLLSSNLKVLQFNSRTDHDVLQWILNLWKAAGTLARW